MTPDTPAAPLRWREVPIEQIVVDTPRVVSVFVPALPGGWIAGQHVDVRLTAPDGYQAQRSYSIASAPGAAATELAIELLEDGEVSPYFHQVARAGDTIEMRGPIGGHFVWRGDDAGSLLLVGGGSGVVPLMAIARHRANVAPATPALLVCSARTFDEMIFRDELIAMQQRDKHFSLVLTTTRGPRPRIGDFERRLDGVLLHEILARWAHAPRRTFVCGSNAFAGAVSSALVGEAIAADSIRVERYGGSES